MLNKVEMRVLFEDRKDAGRKLGEELLRLSLDTPMVLAIPRGGVIVGYEVARMVRAEFDIVVPRKLGAPGEPELAIGAVMHDGSLFLNEDIVSSLGITDRYIEEEKRRQVEESRRRISVYRGERPYPTVRGRAVIVVDDGIATGATIIAAVRWAKAQHTARVVVAAPVGPAEIIPRLRREADDIVCPYSPNQFFAIGQFYRNFGSISDSEVVGTLERAWKGS